MNQKFKFAMAAALLVAAVAAAKAETLYSASIRWDVQDANIDGESVDFYYAMFKVSDVPGAYLFVNPNGEGVVSPSDADLLLTSSFPSMGTSSDPDHTSMFSDLATANYASSANSFYVELYDTDDSLIAQSVKTWSYDELYNIEGCVHGGGSDFGSAANILHVSDFKAVPEPTSGLLLLLGMGLLGLKRKQI